MKIAKTLPLLLGLLASGCETNPLWTRQPVEEPAPLPEVVTNTFPSIGSIERLDPGFDSLIATNTVIEKLADGFEWAEGPVWIKKGNYLLFSDVPKNVVFKWKEGEGISEYLKPSGYTGKTNRGGEPGSNGLTVDRDGRLVLCEHGDRRVAYVAGDGVKHSIAWQYRGRRLNSPNDAVFNQKGDLYFTDPPYGLEGKNKDPKKELTHNGVYRMSRLGEITLLTDKLSFPNGIAFSPDEKILYVAVSDPTNAVIMAYDVANDGTLSNDRVFYDGTSTAKDKKGLPDGLKVDKRGNVFATGPGGVLVFTPDGTHLGTLNTGEATANCGWGDNGTVLYITADMYLCRVKTLTQGTGF